MQINTNASTTLPLNSKSSGKSISTPRMYICYLDRIYDQCRKKS